MSRQFTAEEVVSCYKGAVALAPKDVIVSKTKIDFTQGGRNPLDSVRRLCFGCRSAVGCLTRG
jgi:hypothetical protein